MNDLPARASNGRFVSPKPRWLHHIDTKPRTWFYLTAFLAVGFVQHVVGSVT